MQTPGRWGSLLTRIVASLAGAAFTGVLCGLSISVVTALECIGHTCEDPLGFPVYFSVMGAMLALTLGIIPGFIALSLTRARVRPWRALLVLCPASALGFGLFCAVMAAVPNLWNHIALPVGLLFLLPSASGLLAAFNIDRIPFYRGAYAR